LTVKRKNNRGGAAGPCRILGYPAFAGWGNVSSLQSDGGIDWVSPPGGDAAAQSNQAARLAIGARAKGRQRLAAGWRELAGGSHPVSVAAACP